MLCASTLLGAKFLWLGSSLFNADVGRIHLVLVPSPGPNREVQVAARHRVPREPTIETGAR